MTTTVSSDTFLELARKSGLVNADQLAAVAARHGPWPAQPKRVAGLLVEAKLLTAYQAQLLLIGKSQNFIINGKYKLLDRVGVGGMSHLFLCEHLPMHRRVVLKVLPKRWSRDTVAVERFQRESRALASVSHPNIVQAYNYETSGDMHFLVMEYVEGVNLHQRVKQQGPLPVGEAAGYVAQAAVGLEHVRRAGWVHRDIKPSNLLVTPDGTVKVLDLGLARVCGRDSVTWRNDDKGVLGSADYISPEQALDSSEVDTRSDIYSLGATCYYLLAGQAPFAEGSTAQKLLWHQFKAPPPVRALRDEVPDELAAVLDRMLAKAPADRYQTPEEVVTALAPWVAAPLPAHTEPFPAPEPAERPEDAAGVATRRHTAVTLVEAPMVPDAAAAPAPAPAVESDPSVVDLTARTGMSDFDLPSSLVSDFTDLGPASSGLSLPDASGLQSPPSSGLRPPAPGSGPSGTASTPASAVVPPSRVRPYVWQAVLAGVLGGLLAGGGYWYGQRQVLPDPGPVAPAAAQAPPLPAPDPEADKCCLGHAGAVEGLAFSPDGRLVASAGRDRTLRLWDVRTGQELRRFEGHAGTVWCCAFAPDGRRLLSGGADRTVRLWEAETGQELRRLDGCDGEVRGVAWSADGRRALTAATDGSVRLWDVDTGRQRLHLEILPRQAYDVAFRPGGKQAVSAGSQGDVRVWELSTGQELRSLNSPPNAHRQLALSADGRLAALSGDRGPVLWNLQTGQRVRPAVPYAEPTTGVALTPDGRCLLTGGRDTTVRLWELAGPRELAVFRGHTEEVVRVACSPDGRWAASGGQDGAVRLWRLPAPDAPAAGRE